MTHLLPFAGIALAFAAPTLFQSDSTAAPPARFVLSIDGAPHPMVAGEPLELLIGDQKHVLSLEEKDTRILQAAGLRFEYPRMMSFEYQKDTGSRIWTLHGNDSVVMVFKFPFATSPEDFIAEQISAYSSLGEVGSSDAEITLEGKTIKGKRLTVKAQKFTLFVELFPIDAADASQRWLALQDSCHDGGTINSEFLKVKSMLSATLTRTP